MVAMSGTAQAAAGDAHLAGLHYVALGDSYAAGLGLSAPVGAVPGCGQGTNNYPHQVAVELGLALTDVTCAGATTANLTTTAQAVPGGSNPIQDASLSSTTDIVTVTIGGNDLGFTDVMKSCAALSAAIGPVLGDPLNNPLTLANCQLMYAPGGVDLLSAKIAAVVVPQLTAALTDIAAKAPNAKVFVVGYPALTPDIIPGAGCFTAVSPTLAAPFTANAYPYTDVDVPYLHTVETNLNTAIGSVATTNGAVFVPLLAGTATHSPCASATPYVNGVTVTSLDAFASPPTVDLNVNSLHPNAAGVSYTTAQLLTAIRAAFPAPVAPAGNSAGNPAAPAAILPVTGAEPSGWLVAVAILLLLAGGITLGFDRRSTAARR